MVRRRIQGYEASRIRIRLGAGLFHRVRKGERVRLAAHLTCNKPFRLSPSQIVGRQLNLPPIFVVIGARLSLVGNLFGHIAARVHATRCGRRADYKRPLSARCLLYGPPVLPHASVLIAGAALWAIRARLGNADHGTYRSPPERDLTLGRLNPIGAIRVPFLRLPGYQHWRR